MSDLHEQNIDSTMGDDPLRKLNRIQRYVQEQYYFFQLEASLQSVLASRMSHSLVFQLKMPWYSDYPLLPWLGFHIEYSTSRWSCIVISNASNNHFSCNRKSFEIIDYFLDCHYPSNYCTKWPPMYCIEWIDNWSITHYTLNLVVECFFKNQFMQNVPSFLQVLNSISYDLTKWQINGK